MQVQAARGQGRERVGERGGARAGSLEPTVSDGQVMAHLQEQHRRLHVGSPRSRAAE